MAVVKRKVREQVGGEKETLKIMKQSNGVEELIKEQLGSLASTALVSKASKVSGGVVRIHGFDDEFDRLIRLKEVLAILPISKSNFWAGVKSCRYPAPVRLSSRITTWRLSEIMQLVKGGRP